MTPTDHPLTEARAAELWDARLDGSFWRELNPDQRENALTDMRSGWDAAMRAAYDAGREHEREHEREHADPHHDPRPWQNCTREDIRKGDLVETQSGMTTLRIGVAHRKNENGDLFTDDGFLLTDGDHWPLRRIPAPTPPAEEVELPGEHPAHITDVEDVDGDVCVYMAMNRFGGWIGVDQDGTPREWTPENITAFTLPDGTRARRDGDHEDGTPRFVKAQEGEE